MLKSIILSISFFSLGLTGYLAFLNIGHALDKRRNDRRLEFFYALARAGLIVVVGLISQLVFASPSLPADWKTGLYTLGVLLTAVGYLGIAIEGRKVRRGIARRPE